MSPDATCNYVYAGEEGGKAYLRRPDGGFFIYWDGGDNWRISDELGKTEPPCWTRTDPAVEGEYTPVAPADGTATVTAGEH